MTAPSPGILTRFVIDTYYNDEDAYVAALAEAMKHGIRGDRRRGLPAADRLPRSRLGAQQPVSRT